MVPMNHSQPRSSMAPSDWSGDLSIQVAPTDVRISDVASGCDSQPEHPADPAAARVNIGPQWQACAFYWPWKENIAKKAQKPVYALAILELLRYNVPQ